MIASHLLPIPGRGDPWVVDTLVEAARVAVSRGAPDSAITYLARALEEPPAGDRAADLLLQLGITESMMHGPGSVEHLRAAYESSPDPVTRARAAAALTPVYFFLGMEAEGAAVAESAMAGLGPDDGDLRRVLEACILTIAASDPKVGLHSDVVTRYRTEPLGDDPGSRLLAGMTAYCWAMTGGSRGETVALARHGLGGGVLARLANGAIPYVGAQIVLLMADADDGLDATTEAYRAAHESGSLLAITPSRLFRGMALALRGELVEAETLMRTALTEIDDWGFVTVSMFPGSLLAPVLIERGDLAGARRALEHANPGLARMPETSNSAFWYASFLRYLLAAGEWDRVLEVSDDCRDRFSTSVVNPAWIPWRSIRAQALDRLDRLNEAIDVAETELALARDWGAPRALGRALRVLGAALSHDGLSYLEEAVAVTEGTPARLEHAKALAALDTGLRLARRPADARGPLQRALDVATVSEATTLADHVRTELRAAGMRPRTDALTGVGALTASERRVAEAAARGQSNKEIAQALYVTPKTIEVHLSSAYRKLGIRSRRELAGTLAG